jgi:hypothetical protein
LIETVGLRTRTAVTFSTIPTRTQSRSCLPRPKAGKPTISLFGKYCSPPGLFQKQPVPGGKPSNSHAAWMPPLGTFHQVWVPPPLRKLLRAEPPSLLQGAPAGSVPTPAAFVPRAQRGFLGFFFHKSSAASTAVFIDALNRAGMCDCYKRRGGGGGGRKGEGRREQSRAGTK